MNSKKGSLQLQVAALVLDEKLDRFDHQEYYNLAYHARPLPPPSANGSHQVSFKKEYFEMKIEIASLIDQCGREMCD